MNEENNNRRKQIFIKGAFQQRMILNAMLITLITVNVIIIAAQWLDTRYGGEEGLLGVFNVTVALLEVIAFIVIYFLARKVSFHIAGPVYAVERTLALMNEGKLDHQLVLRQGDQFIEVSQSINTLIGTYAQRLHSLQQLAAGDAELTGSQLQQLRQELQWFTTQPQRDE
jgi:methyl-accepting chemotaxis protein